MAMTQQPALLRTEQVPPQERCGSRTRISPPTSRCGPARALCEVQTCSRTRAHALAPLVRPEAAGHVTPGAVLRLSPPSVGCSERLYSQEPTERCSRLLPLLLERRDLRDCRRTAAPPVTGRYLDRLVQASGRRAPGPRSRPGPGPRLAPDSQGPFQRSQGFVEFSQRIQQGFTTKYKIYRDFGRWTVSSLALERQENSGVSLPLEPDFLRSIRHLGRRPSAASITHNIIRKYGTHFLQSATLGGEESLTIFVDRRKLTGASEASSAWSGNSSVSLESLHQLAASYFIDRESTLRTLHRLQITSSAVKVMETRTGPLGCSNYDNLDSVSSVLVQSPENKMQLRGLQELLPQHLRSRFVQAALNYLGCGEEGHFLCRHHDCWCRCSAEAPRCNCPEEELRALEASLVRIRGSWAAANQDFEESEEFQGLLRRLPTFYALNTSGVTHLWRTDAALVQRYKQLQLSGRALRSRAQRLVRQLFTLSRRCRSSPRTLELRERPFSFWPGYILSILYCSQDAHLGVYLEPSRRCSCPSQRSPCQGLLPCAVGPGAACASCSPENRTRCASCNHGYMLSQGACRHQVADSTERYVGLEPRLRDPELRLLLQRRERRLVLDAVFISNDVRLDSWFDPAWRKRMLLTLRSNKSKSKQVHMLLGVSLQLCRTPNSTLEPALALYINPFGGSHSESWLMPLGRDRYPDWERTPLDLPFHCSNWTLRLGGRWKTFVETLHVHLRGRVTGDGSVYQEPLEPPANRGYMKLAGVQVFGYSVHLDPDAIRDLILQLDYPHTRGSQDSALLQLLEIRERVNRLSPPGPQRLDLFCCLLRHRLKLSSGEVGRIQGALRAFSSHLPGAVEDQAARLCS
ncbi:BMP/retinoic acid-inducible neural-specific protein 3-like [Synchiropus splendidus]|uniref:BMP/retinoic acid-inducible neural-specific protein 3-like n=1 Tax=Synchiropus splendidus TaxID=270530 RepID=UPI00237E419B|nr:BMP/retinoic acid-inducible neural-specific protein 3-like [Synchiropus splendidus]